MALGGSGETDQVTYWVDEDTLTGSDDLFWDSTNKYLGVNVSASPDCPLHVARSGTALEVSANDVGVFQNNGASNYGACVRILGGHETGGSSALYLGHTNNIGLQSISCDNPNDKMTITAGKVGIGIAPVTEKLEVSGKVSASTGFKVGAADGISRTITIVTDADTHRLTFIGGILTGYELNP